MSNISEELKEHARIIASSNEDVSEYELMDMLDVDFETASILIEMLQEEGKIKVIETNVHPKQVQNKQEIKEDKISYNIEYYTKKKNKNFSLYIMYIFFGVIAVLAFFNSMMYFYTHLQMSFLFVLPLCFLAAIATFFASSFLMTKICHLKYFSGILVFLLVSFSVCTYFMFDYTENLKKEIAKNEAAERIKKRAKYQSKVYAEKDCDKQGAKEAIDMIVNGGLAERQNNPDSLIVWYIWKDNWYKFSEEQRYQLTSGIGGAEKCLTGKAIRIRVGNRDVAKSTIMGNVELMDQ